VLPPNTSVIAGGAIHSSIEMAQPLDFLRSIKPLSPPPRLLAAAV
jgi:hypothetical protein